jgi:hypothetical protein
MKYILNSTHTKWRVEPEIGDEENLVESITIKHAREEGKLSCYTKETYETSYEKETTHADNTDQSNLKLSTKIGNTVLNMPTSRAPKKEPENNTFTQEREYVMVNKQVIGYDEKHITTKYDIQKLEAEVREGYHMSSDCNFHRPSFYSSGKYNCCFSAKTKECSFDAEKMSDEHKTYLLRYIKNPVGNFAGPWDRPLNSKLRLGNSVKTFSEYTSWEHTPDNSHKDYSVDFGAYEDLPTLAKIDSLVEEKSSIQNKLEGPCTDKDLANYVYTCKTGECKIPCVCKLCNTPLHECKTHNNVEHESYQYDKHLTSVRNTDSVSLHKRGDKRGLEIGIDDMNKFCTVNDCTPEWEPWTYLYKIPINRNKKTFAVAPEPRVGSTCDQFPFCKSVDIVKFGGIPNDCEECKEDLLNHEAFHLVPHTACKFCKHILKELEGTTDEKSFWEKRWKIRVAIMCHICEEEFGDKNDRDKHIKYIHRKDQQEVLKCDHCDFETIYKKSLNEHNDQIHCKDQMSVLKCDHCDFETIYKKSLNEHNDKIHRKDQMSVFNCNQCDFETTYKKNLNYHIRNIHEKKQQLKLQCYQCDYSSVRPSDLNFHVRTQHTQKPKLELECKQCDFKTDQRKKLTQHVNRKHKHT